MTTGTRLDKFLTDNFPEVPSRSAAQKLISESRVFLNAQPITDKNYRVKPADTIQCEIPAPIPDRAEPENIPLNIIYEDPHLLVIDKPKNMVVHPAPGNYTGTLVNALLHHCGESLSGIGGVLRPGIVHRLDKDTSGLILAAKTDTAHISLSAQLASREMSRTYQAICHGIIKPDTLTINAPIARHPHDRKKMAAYPANSPAREAITHITVLARYKKHTHLQANLETGRTHQIRVHLSHISHPVLCDTTYAPGKKPPQALLHLQPQGQILHAAAIKFTHPATRQQMEFTSPLPQYFTTALETIANL